MPESITTQLYANYGVLALGCAMFSYVIVYLWRHFTAEREKHLEAHKKEREGLETKAAEERATLLAQASAERASLLAQQVNERMSLQARINEQHDARIEDMREFRNIHAAQTQEVTRAMEGMTSTLDMTRAALEKLEKGSK